MKLIPLLLIFTLTGCASYGEYYASVDAANARQVEAQRAQAEADAIRFQALMRIAESGDETAKVAATMALALSGGRGVPAMAVPSQPQNEAIQWASILAPTLMQGFQIIESNRTQRRMNDNSTRLGLSTNDVWLTLGTRDPLVVTQPAPVIVPSPDPVIVNPVVVNPVIVQPQE